MNIGYFDPLNKVKNKGAFKKQQPVHQLAVPLPMAGLLTRQDLFIYTFFIVLFLVKHRNYCHV